MRNVRLVLIATILTHRLCSLVTVNLVSEMPWVENIDHPVLVMYTITTERRIMKISNLSRSICFQNIKTSL